MPNRLSQSASPYLRQHQNNPVDWYAWGQEAFTKAQQENKPIFLSIGYSSCHWCHVMAHECFEDQEVAEALNGAFVSIKVDREELPDVDEAYMTALQITRGHGGWPLSAFLTPDLKPFFLATYLPKEDRGRFPGFLSHIEQLAAAWASESQRSQLVETAEDYTRALHEINERQEAPQQLRLDIESVAMAAQSILEEIDPEHGGFGKSPKFPPHTQLSFLLELSQSKLFDTELRQEAWVAVVFTLVKMARGGIHDHVGGGFHRYSTDESWHLPHFEKMLVDNALLWSLYSKCLRLLKNEDPETEALFEWAANGILEWLKRDLQQGPGLFGSATNADTEGEEGTFYVWTEQEIRSLLGSEADEFIKSYNITAEGNFLDEATRRTTGHNVLSLKLPVTPARDQLAKLFSARESREKPFVDSKAVAFSNGLLAAAFAGADEAYNLEAWQDVIPRLYLDGVAYGTAYLEDIAALAIAFLSHGDRTRGLQLVHEMMDRFWNPNDSTFYATSDEHHPLFGKRRPIFDQPQPSGTALAVKALKLSGHYREAVQAVNAQLGWMTHSPMGTSALWEQAIGLIPYATQPRFEYVAQSKTSGSLVCTLPQGFHLNEPPKVSGATVLQTEEGFELEFAQSPQFPIPVEYEMCDDNACYPRATALIQG